MKRVEEIAIAQGRRPIQWEEVFVHFGSALAKESIVHVWKSTATLPQITSLGYQALINVGYYNESWYLDNLNIQWDAVYANEPCKTIPDEQCPLVLGGHGRPLPSSQTRTRARVLARTPTRARTEQVLPALWDPAHFCAY